MADVIEALKKRIDELKQKLAQRLAATKEPRKDPEMRKLRKQLKRAQRRLKIVTPVSLEDRLKVTQKHLDTIGKLLSVLTQGKKKVMGDPYVHSLRKRTKSLNKRVKRINRTLEKQKKPAPASA